MQNFVRESHVPKTSKIRIYADVDLSVDSVAELNAEQSHYLLTVMRLQSGDKLLVFNNRDGEFDCTLTPKNKKSALLKINSKTRDFECVSDIWLMFAPLKKDRTDFVVEKATELGASRIVPVITRYTISDKIKIERWQAQTIEAAEQSRRVDLPLISEPIALNKLLTNWDSNRQLYFMDETGAGTDIASTFATSQTPAAILVGPEGGFSEEELSLLRTQSYAHSVSLGKRILRAETAVVAALSCFQAICGDWKKE